MVTHPCIQRSFYSLLFLLTETYKKQAHSMYTISVFVGAIYIIRKLLYYNAVDLAQFSEGARSQNQYCNTSFVLCGIQLVLVNTLHVHQPGSQDLV